MKLIPLYPLHRGLFIKVDDEDFEELNKFKWYGNRTGQKSGDGSQEWYAIRSAYDKTTKKRVTVRMHRYLMNAAAGTHVNHINHDTLDNQKGNLEVVNLFQSHQARGRKVKGKYVFKGVRANKAGTKFYAAIVANHELHRYGPFGSAQEAAEAYDEAALKLHGRFAALNFARAA